MLIKYYMAVTSSKRTSKLHTVLRELIERTNSNIMRLRIIEQNSQIMKTRITSVEKAFLAHKKELQKTVSETEKTVKALGARSDKMESALKQIIKEMKRMVTTGQMKELEHLMEIYSPLKSNFITREELEQVLDEKLKARSSKKSQLL